MLRRSDRFTPTCVGKTSGSQLLTVCIRFTPTCVGKTTAGGVYQVAVWVHPHVRGEDVREITRPRVPRGSPPRAWGRRAVYVQMYRFGRFTPTCVGKTGDRRMQPSHTSVHPHVRGEDCTEHDHDHLHLGSPPRAWGRQSGSWNYSQWYRFTPTCVGKTSSSCSF